MLPVSRALFPQVHNHIQYGSGRAIDDLGMVVRRQLKVHAADHVFAGQGKVAFLQLKADAFLLKKMMLKDFNKAAPIVAEGGQVNEESTFGRQRIEMEHDKYV